MSWSDLTASWHGEPGPVPGTEAAVIDAGWAAWRRARDDRLACLLEAADALADALDAYDAIRSGVIHPAAFWPDLEHDLEPYDTGLRMAADAVLQWLAELIRQAPALAGDTP